MLYLFSSKHYRLLILKNENFEFEMTLTKVENDKSSFWSCGKSSDSNNKKLHTVNLTNQQLMNIIKKSQIPQTDKMVTVKIEDFIEVEPREFIRTLKKLINVGFY
jgi:hypothetical protein